MNFIKLHLSDYLSNPDDYSNYTYNLNNLKECLDQVDKYPNAIEIVNKVAKNLIREHLVLYPLKELEAIDFLKLLVKSSSYMMRLYFNPNDIFEGQWVEDAPFEIKKSERKLEFNYHIWYNGILSAVILRDTEAINFFINDYKILHLLEREHSSRDNHQFNALFYETFMYYLTNNYTIANEEYHLFNNDFLQTKFNTLFKYVAELTSKYELDKSCKYDKLIYDAYPRPSDSQKDTFFYYHYFRLMLPCLHLLKYLWDNDEVNFIITYEKAIIVHQEYWNKETDEEGIWEEDGYYLKNSPEGFFSFTLTALASLAVQKEFKLTTNTDYCPDFLINYHA